MKNPRMATNLFGYFRRLRRKTSFKGNKDFLLHKEHALVFAQGRIEYFNSSYQFSVSKICIRNQRTRWGSCSTKGNINFNYKIALLPERLADYVIVHELCHLGEFNHSRRFWALVERTIPDHRELRKELRKSHDTRFSSVRLHT